MKHINKELGDIKSEYSGYKIGSYNTLNIPDELYDEATFWEKYNKPWLEKAIDRGDNIVLATAPDPNLFYKYNKATCKIELTGFGNEYKFLYEHHYRYNPSTHMMVLK
jgi:hypothetical protein